DLPCLLVQEAAMLCGTYVRGRLMASSSFANRDAGHRGSEKSPKNARCAAINQRKPRRRPAPERVSESDGKAKHGRGCAILSDVVEIDLERLGDPFQGRDAAFLLSGLDLGDVGRAEASGLRQRARAEPTMRPPDADFVLPGQHAVDDLGRHEFVAARLD